MTMRAKASDEEILHDVLRELAWDTRVSPTEVGVQVKDGIVTLIGQVDSRAKKMAAEQAVQRIAGVSDVVNDLEVRLAGRPDRSDTEIARDVRHTLEWDVNVPAHQIRSAVSDGVVTLEGDVFLATERLDAERAVERLPGVRRVVDRLQINPSVRADVAEIRAAIAGALEKHDSADADAAQIEIQLGDDGHVELRGWVHSWAERVAALAAARGTRGVRSVREHLDVRP